MFSEFKLPISRLPISHQFQFNLLNLDLKNEFCNKIFSVQVLRVFYIHNLFIWSPPVVAACWAEKKNYEHVPKFSSFILGDSLLRFRINKENIFQSVIKEALTNFSVFDISKLLQVTKVGCNRIPMRLIYFIDFCIQRKLKILTK